MQQKQIQTQKQEQTLQISSVQVAFSHLVELPLMDLEMRVRNELEDNEALEERGKEPTELLDREKHEENDDDGLGEFGDCQLPEMDDRTADYASSDDIPDYLLRQNNGVESYDIQIGQQLNVYDDIYRQMRMRRLTEHEREVMEYLIGSLDDNGYLSKDNQLLADEMEIYHYLETSVEEVDKLRHILQTFEPYGIGAFDLQECLRIQLEHINAPLQSKALKVINNYFYEFTHKHWEDIQSHLQLNDEELKKLKHLILHLNPKPVGDFNETAAPEAPTVIPDFYLKVDQEGEISIGLNKGDVPELRVSRSFKDTINEFSGKGGKLSRKQNEELLYARKKVNSAQLFIDMMRRRRETLLSVMNSIALIQKDFFRNEDDETLLVPMTLKDVTEHTNVDISTVSRVTSSKYVRTYYGQYPLRYFFSSVFTSDDGEEVSSRQAKLLLQKIIEEEDKKHPYSDERLSILMKERGQPISRRTVTKYREQLDIPKSRLRRN